MNLALLPIYSSLGGRVVLKRGAVDLMLKHLNYKSLRRIPARVAPALLDCFVVANGADVNQTINIAVGGGIAANIFSFFNLLVAAIPTPPRYTHYVTAM